MTKCVCASSAYPIPPIRLSMRTSTLLVSLFVALSAGTVGFFLVFVPQQFLDLMPPLTARALKVLSCVAYPYLGSPSLAYSCLVLSCLIFLSCIVEFCFVLFLFAYLVLSRLVLWLSLWLIALSFVVLSRAKVWCFSVHHLLLWMQTGNGSFHHVGMDWKPPMPISKVRWRLSQAGRQGLERRLREC